MNIDIGPLGLWPPQASPFAVSVDRMVIWYTVAATLFVAPVFIALIYFGLKYRQNRDVDRSQRESRNVRVELAWTITPFAVMLVFFYWAGTLYVEALTPPKKTMDISAVGRQWMWKFQHGEGQQEINALHLPAGEAMRMTMISQDVIHAFYVPALRVQFDVLPGRYTHVWFQPDRVGNYRLYCAQYCGTDHSSMDGIVTILSPADYQTWLRENGTDQSLAAQGAKLFVSYGCSGCHGSHAVQRAPSLDGIYGHAVALSDGTTVMADDAYIRDSILIPRKQVAAGYAPIMPSFSGQVSEDDLVRLVAYVKSLGAEADR
jgi:cytochrome c oxidase subunit 2